jgi:hypothetical protein
VRQREYVCKNASCPGYREVPTMTADEKLYCECGGLLELAIHPLQVVFTGPLTARYNYKDAENPHQEGHWAWRRKSSLSGKPEPVFIDSFDAQRQFCASEGLVNPKELPRNYQISETGKGEINTRGLPGTEW